MKTSGANYQEILDSVPDNVNESDIIYMLQSKQIGKEYIDTLKGLTDLSDETISSWLNISVRSFQTYRQSGVKLKENIKEQLLVLLSLIKHGIRVFGSKENFDRWLTSGNFYLDGKLPLTFLNTVTGARFIDDRLTAMEFGDNV